MKDCRKRLSLYAKSQSSKESTYSFNSIYNINFSTMNFSSTDADRALRLLAEAAESREADFDQYSVIPQLDDSDEESDSDSPYMDQIMRSAGSEGILKMCNFSITEFQSIWNNLNEYLSTTYNVGRGKKCPTTAKDMLFMTLTVLKTGGKWDTIGQIFNIKGPTFERQITKFVDLLVDYMYLHYVEKIREKYTMEYLINENVYFHNYKYCRYATDVTFQQCNRPCGNMQEGKKYFSGKHKLYGYKVEASVLPNGLCIGFTYHQPGSTSDFDIFTRNLEFHKNNLKKVSINTDNDDGELSEEYSESWGILLDKGYQGGMDYLRAIHPCKKPINGSLSLADESRNRKISSDRVIVENYFGRLCNLWNLLCAKWRWNESLYDKFFTLGVAFTNIHINMQPLKIDDRHFFNKVKNRLYTIGQSQVEKRQQAQAAYRARRRQRIEGRFSDSFETTGSQSLI